MKHSFTIPTIMQHLPFDERGYPIPYFVAIVNGKPDFRYQDPKKREAMIKHNKCFICGRTLYAKSFWFITGPLGLANRVGSDAPSHEDCARFSLAACPHLLYPKAERRSDVENLDVEVTAGSIREHPMEIFLVKADKVDVATQDKQLYFRWRPVQVEHYAYVNEKLTRIMGTDGKKEEVVLHYDMFGLLVDDEVFRYEGREYTVKIAKQRGDEMHILVRGDGKAFVHDKEQIRKEGAVFRMLN
jgi:hypothetical protein